MLNAAEREQIRKDNPDCYFTRVIGYGLECVIAIPKPTKPIQRGGMFDCPEMLHGATIKLGK